MKKRIVSLLLVLCILLTALPVTVLAEEVAGLNKDTDSEGLCAHHTAHNADCGYIEGVSSCEYQCTECAAAGITFSSTRLALIAEATSLSEGCGTLPITLTRFSTDAEQKFTVVVFDSSTNYGEDYTISYLGETAKKLANSQSIYDAFKANGELTDGVAFDLVLSAATSVAEAEAEQSGEEQESVSAADMLSQLDELNARAVEITVTFPVGTATQMLHLNVIDDSESEYEESFMMAVLDEKGEVIEGAQQSFSILDNEATRPSVTVSFDCEDEMELTDEDKSAMLTFKRTGDLATSTLVTLNYDGKAYGLVDFAPYQTVQTVEAVVEGVYTLEPGDGVKVGGGQVEVFDNTTTTYSVEEGGDEELDAIPDSYAVIRTPRTAIDTSWVPSWVTNGSSELYEVIAGDTKTDLYKQGGGGAGSVKTYVDGTNIHNVSTRRSGSKRSKGHRNMDLVNPIDLIGVESVETTIKVDALEKGEKSEAYFGIEGLPWNTRSLADKGEVLTYVVEVPTDDWSYRQGSKKVYYSNIDPNNKSGGTDMYVPNALKLNLRKYRFIIESDVTKMSGLNDHMTYGEDSTLHVPNIATNMHEQVLTINSKDYGTDNKKVVISYESSVTSEYPARLVGFCVRNYKTGQCSAQISLISSTSSKSTDPWNATTYYDSFTFDESFLRQYEKDYCVYTSSTKNGAEMWTFQIVPIYEKIYVGQPTIRSSVEGTLKITSLGSDCLGDQWKIEGVANGEAKLSGVWYQAKNSAQAIDAVDTKTTYNNYKNQNNVFVLDIEHNSYTLEGIWSTDAARLLVYYEQREIDNPDYGKPNEPQKITRNASDYGVLETKANAKSEIVSADAYIVGDVVTLIAKPKEGYYTRWHVKDSTDYYYGDTLYYQLDGNPDHNILYVDFVSQAELKAEGKTVSTSTLTGELRQSYIEARNGAVTQFVPMDNTAITTSACDSSGKAYGTTTDDKGNFTITGFTGVEGQTYSMMVLYDNEVGYTTFVYDSTNSSYYIQMPQFPTGQPYPAKVDAYVSGKSREATSLNVSTGSTIVASTSVYVPANGSKVTGVKYFFADPELVKNGANPSKNKGYEAKNTGTDSRGYELWTAEIANSAELISGMRMYVVVSYEKTTYKNENGTTTKYINQMSTGEVDTGYNLYTAVNDDSYNVVQEIPSVPGMQDSGTSTAIDEKGEAHGQFWDLLDIPVLGRLDFSFSSKNGGFFTTRVDENNNTYMMCGSTALNYYATGSVTQKLEKLQKEREALGMSAAQDTQQNEGAANPNLKSLSDNSSVKYLDGQANWSLDPAYLFMFVLTPKSGGGQYVSGYLMTLGVDAFFARSFPMSFYGVPLYVSATFTTEAYWSLQISHTEAQNVQLEDVGTDAVEKITEETASGETESGGTESGTVETASGTKVSSFFGAPVMKVAVKGGVGFNGFLSLYLTGAISAPFIISLYPGGIGTQFAFTIGFGAELTVFNVEVDATLKTPVLATDETLLSDLKTITGQSSGGVSVHSASAQNIADQSTITDALREALSTDEIMEQLNNATFSPIVTSAGSESLLRAYSNESGLIDKTVFKNTGVHLLKLSDTHILAFYLRDTRADGTDTLNYLTVAYAESFDGGESWTKKGSVNDNTGGETTSLQYDVNLFDLDDGYTLVTWSEANFDKMVEETNIDFNKLTVAQVAAFMNAMSLKGRLMYQGEFVGDAFYISEDSPSVYCGALDAVRNDDMLYVYYQRNIFPVDMNDGDEVKLEDIVNTTRTIALARAEITKDGVGEWNATQVRALNDKGQEYRITDVEPFVHDGVLGEILVLDRDGKLAEWNGESWEPSDEDRQLYLRTYTFDEDGKPTPTALMAITDPTDCCQNPQVVSNDDYLHLFWNRNGEIVYVSDFVATEGDEDAVKEAAYLVVNSDGSIQKNDPKEDDYGANHIASDDEHLNIGTTFSASMDNDGHVLLSWVATDIENAVLPEESTDPGTLIDPSTVMSDEVFGVVLQTVSNADAADAADSSIVFEENDADNEAIRQLLAKGSPIALTHEQKDVGALDSVFLGHDTDENSSFLLAFSTMNYEEIELEDQDGQPMYDEYGEPQTKRKITSADVKSVRSSYATDLEITSISAPQYPMPGENMTVTVTVANNGLKEAKNVSVLASAATVGSGSKTIASILPGQSETIELTVAVSGSFGYDALMSVTATCGNDVDTGTVQLLYGSHFIVTQMPTMSNITGTSDYTTATMIYNDGNAAGTPELYYEVNLFADDGAPTKSYAYTATEEIREGSAAIVSYVLQDTPVASSDDIGMLTVYTADPENGMNAKQYIQGQMPRLKSTIQRKSDVPTLDSSDSDSSATLPDSTVTDTDIGTGIAPTPAPTVTVSFTDVFEADYYYDAVLWAVENKITEGTSKLNFSPDDDCTRAQAVTFLWRSAGSPAPTITTMPFTDVPETAYYYDAVLWAVENGITTGTTATTFSPSDSCTRAQIVAFIYRLEKSKGGGFTGAWAMRLPFTDTPDWAYEPIAWCYMRDITTGLTKTLFGPDEICTRAQIVTFLYRYSKGGST